MRVRDEILREYSGDSLAGYADKTYSKGGKDLLHQQRGLILPILERHLKKVNAEIGTGNGDVVAYLAEKHPDKTFVGVDFSVKNAQEKYQTNSNLHFVGGYALDLLERGIIRGDLAFASSTFCLFTPIELESYLALLKRQGFSGIVLNEPTWGKAQKNNDEATSSLLEGNMYHHNWAGYLRKYGYEIRDFAFFPYKHPISKRPNIYVCVLYGELE